MKFLDIGCALHSPTQARSACVRACDSLRRAGACFTARKRTVPHVASVDASEQKERPPPGGLSEARPGVFDQVATATAFCFLRRPSKSSMPRPSPKTGSAAESETRADGWVLRMFASVIRGYCDAPALRPPAALSPRHF
jgi:hypothetical protein